MQCWLHSHLPNGCAAVALKHTSLTCTSEALHVEEDTASGTPHTLAPWRLGPDVARPARKGIHGGHVSFAP
jgi:hypothetical protein